MKIAVDFDGTIVEHRYPAIGKELPFAITTLLQLQKDGHQLILWTSREGQLRDDAVKFCHDRGLDFYAVNCEYPNGAWDGKISTRKIRVDIYIDDRQIGGLPDWKEIYDILSDKDFKPGYMKQSSSHHHHHKKHKGFGIFSAIAKRCAEARSHFNK